jgi:hypothetical protein
MNMDAVCLLDMPNEIITCIYEYLRKTKDCFSFSLTCKRLRICYCDIVFPNRTSNKDSRFDFRNCWKRKDSLSFFVCDKKKFICVTSEVRDCMLKIKQGVIFFKYFMSNGSFPLDFIKNFYLDFNEIIETEDELKYFRGCLPLLFPRNWKGYERFSWWLDFIHNKVSFNKSFQMKIMECIAANIYALEMPYFQEYLQLFEYYCESEQICSKLYFDDFYLMGSVHHSTSRIESALLNIIEYNIQTEQGNKAEMFMNALCLADSLNKTTIYAFRAYCRYDMCCKKQIFPKTLKRVPLECVEYILYLCYLMNKKMELNYSRIYDYGIGLASSFNAEALLELLIQEDKKKTLKTKIKERIAKFF